MAIHKSQSSGQDLNLQICCYKNKITALTLSLLLITQEAFVDSVDQDQTARSVQSDQSDLHCPCYHSRF